MKIETRSVYDVLVVDMSGRLDSMSSGDAGDRIVPVVTQVGIMLLWLSALLTLYTGWDYMRAGLRYVIDE